MSPAQLQRRGRVEQHLRYLLQHARQGERHARGGAEAAGIAKRRLHARRAFVDQPHREALALQMKRAADADQAGADDRELLQDETSRTSLSLAYRALWPTTNSGESDGYPPQSASRTSQCRPA